MKITTAAEMREIDRGTSERFGVASLSLMEKAGGAVADVAASLWPQARKIGIICGKGNNGGDGFVAARRLRALGKSVGVLLLAEPAELRGDAAAMFARMGIEPRVARSAAELGTPEARAILGSDLLIDGILGTGFHPPVSGLYAEAIQAIHAAAAPVVAIDIPSGADSDAFAPDDHLKCRADAIVTFTAPRPAHVFGGLTAGPVVVAPIGSPEEAIVSQLELDVVAPRDVLPMVEARPRVANKGNFGHVLVVGGSLGKAGAAAMAGLAALRTGAGLATVATAQSVLPTVAGFAPEVMTEPLAESEAGTISITAREYGRLDAIVRGKTVLALGPGISRHPDTVQFIRAVVDKYQLPLVIDADGLNAFEGAAERLDGSARPLVLTPHPGEMSRLTGLSTKEVQADRIGVARRFAREHHCFLVLKGHRTLVAEPGGHVWVNPTGNPGMASGGTGDVLTGAVAAMVAQHPNNVARAVAAAVYLHGLAGDVACESVGEHSLIATDLLAGMPEAFRRTRERAGEPMVTIGP